MSDLSWLLIPFGLYQLPLALLILEHLGYLQILQLPHVQHIHGVLRTFSNVMTSKDIEFFIVDKARMIASSVGSDLGKPQLVPVVEVVFSSHGNGAIVDREHLVVSSLFNVHFLHELR